MQTSGHPVWTHHARTVLVLMMVLMWVRVFDSDGAGADDHGSAEGHAKQGLIRSFVRSSNAASTLEVPTAK